MKKALFISNLTDKFTNFMIPSIEVLQKLGYQVHTCANYSNFKDDEKKYNVVMHHIDCERKPYNLKNIKAYKQLMKIMKEEKFDLVHCNTPIGGLLGRICAKKNRVKKVIYTAHGFHFYQGAPLINNILYKNIEKWLAHYTDVIITINQEDYEAAQKFKLRNNGKVYMVHGVGVETNTYKIKEFDKNIYRSKLGLNSEDIMIISAGDLIKRKNYPVSIKAIDKCKNEKINYFICGDGPERKKLERLVKKLNLTGQIHFLGYRDDIKQLMNSADIFLFSTFQEGLPRSMMEAMAAGIPCIVSNIRGNVDLIQDEKGGFLCDVNDVEKISNSLLKLSKDKSLREKMGQVNKNNVKKYDVKNVIKELEKIYMLK